MRFRHAQAACRPFSSNVLSARSHLAAQFCWGAYPVLKAAATPGFARAGSLPRLVAVASFHPSTHYFAEISGEDDIELARRAAALGVPQLVRATRMEPAKWQPDGAVHQILREQLGDTDCTFECADGTHGFMIRSTMKSAREAAAVRKGIGELISFCGGRL